MIQQNKLIKKEYKKDNDYLFITNKGNPTNNSVTSNSIQKQLRKYTLEYGIKNINPHALRRGFAKNLYEKSNGDILLVSKALGHNDLSVTTQYLHVALDETARKLRVYLCQILLNSEEQQELLIQLLDQKKQEIESRYCG